MGRISALYVHKVVDAATAGAPQQDARRRALFQSVGVDPDAPVDPRQMVDDRAYYALCERVWHEDPHPASVPIRVGASMRCDDYGAFGLAWKTAVDLRGSYQRAERYGLVLTSVATFELIEEAGRVFLLLHRTGQRHLGLRMSNEQSLVAVTQISREVSAHAFSPVAVFFRHAAPDDLSAHAAYFGCPVHHDADRDAVEVTPRALTAPNLLGDASVSAFFDSHMEAELARLPDVDALDRRVRIQIAQALSQGVPSVADVAGRLGVSTRTLQRRLAEQGHAFQDLVDDARQDLAKRLLRGSDYALAEIAFLTGFAEQSTFSRAFKRWSGETPASYRRGLRSA